jgi:hypothetical protein
MITYCRVRAFRSSSVFRCERLAVSMCFCATGYVSAAHWLIFAGDLRCTWLGRTGTSAISTLGSARLLLRAARGAWSSTRERLPRRAGFQLGGEILLHLTIALHRRDRNPEPVASPGSSAVSLLFVEWAGQSIASPETALFNFTVGRAIVVRSSVEQRL